MSAPRTNIEKQEERHKAPLIGMGAGIALVVVLFLALLAWWAYYGETPMDEPVNRNDATAPVVVEPAAPAVDPAVDRGSDASTLETQQDQSGGTTLESTPDTRPDVSPDASGEAGSGEAPAQDQPAQ